MNCRFCGKSFSRGFNLRRHKSEYCPLQDHNSSIESGSDQSTGMSKKRKYADTDDSTSEIRIIQIVQIRNKRMNMKPIPGLLRKWKQWQKICLNFKSWWRLLLQDGLEEEEARDKAYLSILPKLRTDFQSIYLNRLLWIAQMKKDPIHKQIMKMKDAFANDNNFDPKEALEAAVDKRKFLMKRLFGDTRSTNTL